jgi:hypothetical protein
MARPYPFVTGISFYDGKFLLKLSLSLSNIHTLWEELYGGVTLKRRCTYRPSVIYLSRPGGVDE